MMRPKASTCTSSSPPSPPRSPDLLRRRLIVREWREEGRRVQCGRTAERFCGQYWSVAESKAVANRSLGLTYFIKSKLIY
jgi:hypothetical protein